MTLRRLSAAALAAACLCATAAAQVPALPGPPPGPPVLPAARSPAVAPLLYLRIAGPAGLRAGFYEPAAPAHVVDAPAVLGLRPGYVYRMELSGLPVRPEHPEAPRTLYPTVEVRASVALAPGVNGVNFPLPLVFTPDEIARAQDGSFVTKVAFLECPDRALAVDTNLDKPLEIDVRAPADPVCEARLRGQVVAIVRFGERQVPSEELARRGVPGTILFPGEKALGPPARPPDLPWACWPAYDPVLGPKPPAECLCDGGDTRLKAGFGPAGELEGVDPSDTIAEYTDSRDRRRLACSNRVCILAPRFAWTRLEILPAGYQTVTGPVGTTAFQGEIIVESRLPGLVAYHFEHAAAHVGRERPSIIRETEGTVMIDQFAGLAIAVGQQQGVSVVGVCKKMVPEACDKLVLCKTVDRNAAQVGDVVTFTLKYTNIGGNPIRDVAVSDSLTGRLEYVPGSQRTDRGASFTTQPNEDGSLLLRWQFPGDLLPGQTGVIAFQARVR